MEGTPKWKGLREMPLEVFNMPMKPEKLELFRVMLNQKITDLLEARKPLYDAIEHQIDTTHLSSDLTADRVIEIYEKAAQE